jgi:hypothetical protein
MEHALFLGALLLATLGNIASAVILQRAEDRQKRAAAEHKTAVAKASQLLEAAVKESRANAGQAQESCMSALTALLNARGALEVTAGQLRQSVERLETERARYQNNGYKMQVQKLQEDGTIVTVQPNPPVKRREPLDEKALEELNRSIYGKV